MKIPSRHILKTVTETVRPESDMNVQNLHIGRTLRDLEMHTEEKSNDRLQALLEDLEHSERRRRN